MKKLIFFLLLINVLFNVQGQYTSQVVTSTGELSFGTKDNFDLVQISNNQFTSIIGSPQVPIKIKRYVLPYDAVVSSVEITDTVKVKLQNHYHIYPAQPPVILDGRPTPSFVQPDPNVYGSSNSFPGKTEEVISDGFFKGYKIVTLCFYPIEYHPVTDEVFLLTEISFRINYSLTPNPLPLPENISYLSDHIAKKFLSSLVENYEDIDTISGGALKVCGLNQLTGYYLSDEFPLNKGTIPDFIIITSHDLKASFQELATRRTIQGFPTYIVTTKEIDSLSSGWDLAEKIRNYIKILALRYGNSLKILLGGDIDKVPYRQYWTNGSTQMDEFPTDVYFSSAYAGSGNWNRDGNNIFGDFENSENDKHPSHCLGRAIVSTSQEAERFIQTIERYESMTTSLKSALDSTLVFAGYLCDNKIEHLGCDLNEVLTNNIPLQLGKWRIFSDYTGFPCPSGTDFGNEEFNRQNFINALNGHLTVPGKSYLSHFIVHHDHSGPFTLGASNKDKKTVISVTDIDNSSIGAFPSIFFALGCETTDFSKSCITKHFVKDFKLSGSSQQRSGILSAIGSSKLSNKEDYTRFQHFCDYLYNLHGYNNIDVKSPRYLGDAFDQGFTCMPYDQNLSWTLLGDPSVPVWTTNNPENFSPTYTALHTGVNQSFIITNPGFQAGKEVLACLYKENEVYLRALVTATSSMLTITFTNFKINSQGEIFLSLTANGYRPFLDTLDVVQGIEPNLYVKYFSIDDDTIGQSSGNGDNITDAGETIEMPVYLSNSGQTRVHNVTGTLFWPNSAGCPHPIRLLRNFTTFQSASMNPDSAYLINPDKYFPDNNFEAYNRINLEKFNLSFSGIKDSSNVEFNCNDTVFVPVHIPNLVIDSLGYRPKPLPSNSQSNLIVPLYFELRNVGSSAIDNALGILSIIHCNSGSVWKDSVLFHKKLANGNLVSDTLNPFKINISSYTPGQHISLQLVVQNIYKKSWVFLIDTLIEPSKLSILGFNGSQHEINLWWIAPNDPTDRRYNLYRGTNAEGPYQKLNTHPLTGASCFTDIGLPEFSQFYYRVASVSQSGIQGVLSDPFKAWTSLPLHADWPIQIPPELGNLIQDSPMSEDVNHDGTKEIFITAGNFNKNGTLLGFSQDGKELLDIDNNTTTLSGYFPFDAYLSSTPAISDVNNDGEKEIIVNTHNGPDTAVDYNRSFAISTSELDDTGKPKVVWSKETQAGGRGNVISNISTNGNDSIIVGVKPEWETNFFLMHGKDGNDVGGWPPETKNFCGYGMPVIADINKDGHNEYIIGCDNTDGLDQDKHRGIFIFTDEGQAYLSGSAVKGLFFENLPAASQSFNYDRMGSPPIVVTDENRFSKIFCVSGTVPNMINDTTTVDTIRVFALSADNQQGSAQFVENWGYDDHKFMGEKYGANLEHALPVLSIGDINGDGKNEVCIACRGKLYIWDQDGRKYSPNFPFTIDSVHLYRGAGIAPLLADVNGDNTIDVICASRNQDIYAIDPNESNPGNMNLRGWPLHVGGVRATPCIDDIDNDGKSEIIAASRDEIYVWDCEGASNKIVWGKFRLNPQNNAVVLNPCELSGDTIVIDSSVTWYNDRFVGNNITIRNGGILTIKCKVEFSSEADIKVETGGQLVIDGGFLTSKCPMKWKGILVAGNPELNQIPSTNQGYVSVLNHGEIDCALQAIRSVDGGLVQASDAIFRNNSTAVYIGGYPGHNLSHFTRCEFELTDWMTCFGSSPYFLYFNSVKRIDVLGCKFKNSINSSVINYSNHGTGIFCTNASVYIGGSTSNGSPGGSHPPTINTEFQNLYRGIHALRSEGLYSLDVRDSTRFENNFRGLYASGYNGSSYLRIIGSKFNVLPDVIIGNTYAYGGYLNNCSGYAVEDNEFYSEGNVPAAYGLIINESGPDANMVYHNSFHNLNVAAQTQGCNRNGSRDGLCFKCNDFNNDSTNINVLGPQEGTNQGIAVYQGSDSIPVNNKFHSHAKLYDIYNSFDVIQYYHSYEYGLLGLTPNPTFKVNDHSTYNTISCQSNSWNGGSIESLRTNLQESCYKTDSIRSNLAQLVDGGSTEELYMTVQLSTPPEATNIHDNLLYVSPYLSDSVLKTSILKEDVMPNIMIRDVMVANPQSVKSEEIMYTLDQRFIPMPDSLYAQILQGESIIGAKEIKERELLSWNQNYASTYKTLIMLYSEDTTGVFSGDSLMNLVNSNKALNSRYDLISLYFDKGLYTTGYDVLFDIPGSNHLTPDQTVTYNNFVSLFNIIELINENPLGFAGLNSNQVTTLLTLSINDKELPGAYARNVLVANNVISYDEPILLPEPPLKSKRTIHVSSANVSADPFSLRIYPNPAQSYFIFEYKIPECEMNDKTCTIEVYDILGHQLLQYSVEKVYDQFLINCEKLQEGIYIVSLKSNGKTKGLAKVLIQK